MANEPDVLIYDPDIGPMVAVTLPATSIVLDGVPVVCDIDRELLIVPSGTQPAQIFFAIQQHMMRTGRRPRAVIMPMPGSP